MQEHGIPTTLEGFHPSVLVVTEHFPSRIQPWLLNSIEELVLRGGKVTIMAGRCQGTTFPQKILDMQLLQRTRYCPTDSVIDVMSCVKTYLMPLSPAGRNAYRGLARLLKSDHWRAGKLKRTIKTMMRAPALGELFDIVHAHYLHGAYEYLPIAQAAGAPVVTTFHGLPPPGVNILASDRAAVVFRMGTLFLVNTRFAKEQLEWLGCTPGKNPNCAARNTITRVSVPGTGTFARSTAETTHGRTFIVG